MSAERAPLCLDITRLVRRAGTDPLTGIDRVERAYLAGCLASGRSFRAYCRTALGWIEAGPAAAAAFLDWVDGALPPPAGKVGALIARKTRLPALEAALRAGADAVLTEGGLLRRLAAAGGGSWISVGHVNPGAAFLGRVGRAGCRRVVMLHDTIPLDHPEWSGEGAPARFAALLAATTAEADLILCPSRVTAANVARHAPAASARIRVVPLGVTAPSPAPADFPRGLPPPAPCFVVVGTIEPRKDHALLLDVWDGFRRDLAADRVPHLVIAGRRGWQTGAFAARLKASPLVGTRIHEAGGLSDGAVSALMAGARAVLHPSRAEGFGLVPAEAAMLGAPVLATDLPVTREVVGDWPTYLPPGDPWAWSAAILAAMASPRPRAAIAVPQCNWTEHFNRVLNLLQ